MKSKGKFLLDRNIWDNPIFKDKKPMCEGLAFIKLLSDACYDSMTISIMDVNGKQKDVKLKRGEIYVKLDTYKDIFNWKQKQKNSVYRFLTKLEKNGTLIHRNVDGLKDIKIYKFVNYDSYQTFKNVTDDVTDDVTEGGQYQSGFQRCDVTDDVTDDVTSYNKGLYNESCFTNLQSENGNENFSDEKGMDSYDDLNDEILYEIENNSSNNSSLVYKNKDDFKNTANNLLSFSLENISLEYPDKDTFLFFCKNKLGFNENDDYLIYNYDILSKNNWKDTTGTLITNWKSYAEKVLIENYNPKSFRNYFKKNNTTSNINASPIQNNYTDLGDGYIDMNNGFVFNKENMKFKIPKSEYLIQKQK